jgi:hypothetical protein
LTLSPISTGCFYATLSPQTVSIAANALARLDLRAIAHDLNPDEEE